MARRPTTSTRRKTAKPAAAPEAKTAARGDEQLLTFLIGRDEYGISILRVREIAEDRPLTPVPMRPQWMRGVMNLRGTVVPVVDLASKLGLGTTVISRFTCLIIVDLDVEGESTVIAVMVDAVRRVVDVRGEDIQEAPPFGLELDIIPGMVRVDGELIVLLDLATILSERELTGAAEVLPALHDGGAVAHV
ncbi:MAG TPA: chemotaxis protein CheW [Thermoanaerobaculia bacterium]|nr:chemotaxis protein CheW [Thermoanaerobaculia bacterium]